ncbi:hypothetical protein BB561_005629 [Smittium simulii]|uniref:EF-hand domain-containing protein n=1 Tax=Smittium simulii TaxID=133385 RepID=A0A2T9Y9I4_9FUNG|nr:hypothetical protein BB561_005629 [Smittium simulii]
MDDNSLISRVSLIAFGTLLGIASCYTYLKLSEYQSYKKRTNETSTGRYNHRQSNYNNINAETNLTRRNSFRRRARREVSIISDSVQQNPQQDTQITENGFITPENATFAIANENDEILENNNHSNSFSLEDFDSETENHLQNNFNTSEDPALSILAETLENENNLLENSDINQASFAELTETLSSFVNAFNGENQNFLLENINPQLDQSISGNSNFMNRRSSSYLLQKNDYDTSKSDYLSSKMFELLYLLHDTKDKRTYTIHRGITCDECNTYPVTGARYKCAQCSNYDLCEFCEAKNVHKHHVFIKIKIPAPSTLKDHTPVLSRFYPGNMLEAYVPASKFAKILSHALKMKSKFNKSEIFVLYDEYCSLANYTIGSHGITKQNFTTCIGIHGAQNPVAIETLFNFYDKNRDGIITFDEMVYGMGVFLRGSVKEKAREFFRAYDTDNDNVVTLDDIQRVASSSFLSNQRAVQDVVSFINNNILMSPSAILPDQPISSAFTSNIPADSHSVLDKQVESLRDEVSILKRSALILAQKPELDITSLIENNTGGFSSENLPESSLGRTDIYEHKPVRSFSYFSNLVESADKSRSTFEVSKDNIKSQKNTQVLKKNSTNNENKNININNSGGINSQNNRSQGDNGQDKNHQHNESQSVSKNTKVGAQILNPIMQLPQDKINSHQLLESSLTLEKSESESDFSNDDDIFISSNKDINGYSSTFNMDLSNINQFLEEPTLQDDWPIVDILVKDAVISITDDLMKKTKNLTKSSGLNRDQFVELCTKDPRLIQWMEILGSVF